MPSAAGRRRSRRLVSWGRGVVLLVLFAIPGAAQGTLDLPPSPWDILSKRDLETPVLDAVPFCRPAGLDPALEPVLEQAEAGEWRSASGMLEEWGRGLDRVGPELTMLETVFLARGAGDREALLEAEDRLRERLQQEGLEGQRLCGRLELARVLLLLSREAEASAQLTRAQQWIDEHEDPGGHAEEIDFGRAEVLYRTGRRFEAHLAFRKLARAQNARLALAARLRLTDLSFEAGKAESVLLEYEALLPRAAAFGASTAGWALRASEAAVDADDPGRALRWLDRFLEGAPDRDLRDAAEIRRADLDVVFDDPLGARKRLAAVSARRRGDALGGLAAVRAIDLGVAGGSPEQQLDVLLRTLRDQRDGVRRYALGVLMRQLERRGDRIGALAVATRLAYDGVDPVVNPGYERDLAALLHGLVDRHEGPEGCREIVRGLGGRYGILIERASDPAPFARVGDCFERMELPWLAVRVYRTIARRFGTAGAEHVALPLARSSLVVGETTLARRMALAALDEPDAQAPAWKAIVAEADHVEGLFAEAARGLRELLDEPTLARQRARLSHRLALTLEATGSVADARLLAARVPDWLAAGVDEPRARAGLVETALRAAHALRKAGETGEASTLYRVVEQEAEPGALRSAARFWLGMAGARDAGGEPAWGADPELELGSPWARYALFERRFAPLRDAYSQTE